MMVALILFGLAAVGGIIMAISRFRGEPQPPMALALVHGLAAAAGLAVLIALLGTGSAASAASAATVALVLLVIAAAGGFVLFASHLRKKELPIVLMVAHAIAAVVGFLILLLGTSV